MGVAVDLYLALFVDKFAVFLWSPLKTASIDFSHPSCMYSIESACLEPLVDLCNTRLHTSNTVPG